MLRGGFITIDNLGTLKKESSAHEEECIAWEQAMPNAADNLGDKHGTEWRLLAFGSQTHVHICTADSKLCIQVASLECILAVSGVNWGHSCCCYAVGALLGY